MTISMVASENTKEDLESLASSGYYPNYATNRVEERTKSIVIYRSAAPVDCDVVQVSKDNGYGGGTLIIFIGHKDFEPVIDGEDIPILKEIK